MRSGEVISGSVHYYQQVGPLHKKRGRKGSPSSCGCDTRSFLNDTIECIPLVSIPTEEVKYDKAYSELMDAAKRFCDYSGIEFDIKDKDDDIASGLNRLTGWFSDMLRQRFDLDFMAIRDDDGEITFVVYRSYPCIEYSFFSFYVNPVQHLPKEVAEFYKRFLKYVSYVLCSDIDPERTDNRYLQMLLDCYEEEDESEMSLFYKSLLKYSGEFYDLFVEVKVTESHSETLYKEMDAYRKKCPAAYLDLIEIMMEGMEILPHMHLSEYDFNPYYDGYDYGDEAIALYDTICFLYSSRDEVDEEIESMINSDVNSGLVPSGWNQCIVLNEKMGKEDVKFIIKPSPYPEKFIEWYRKFYQEIEKYDLYGTDRCSEQ